MLFLDQRLSLGVGAIDGGGSRPALIMCRTVVADMSRYSARDDKLSKPGQRLGESNFVSLRATVSVTEVNGAAIWADCLELM